MSVFSATGAGVNSAFGGADNGQGGQNTLQSTLSVKEPIGVAIVDDEEAARVVLQDMLARSGEYEIVGAYASGEEALREIPVTKPKVVLMDIRMPGISGIECMRLLKGMLPGLVVVLVSGLVDAETMSEALNAGGDAYLTKPYVIAQFLATLRFSTRRSDSNTRETSAGYDRESPGLTRREEEVMNCVAQGLLYKEIEDKLHLSSSVLKKIQHKVFTKLRVSNRTEAVIRWLKDSK